MTREGQVNMGFTVKAVEKARAKRDNGKKGPLTRFNNNIPPVPAGPKNSNGPKGGSKKTSQRFNRARLYAAKGEKII